MLPATLGVSWGKMRGAHPATKIFLLRGLSAWNNSRAGRTLMSASTGYHRIFLALLVGVITVGFLVVMRNFLVTVMLAAIFTVMLYPGYLLSTLSPSRCWW
jgi:hypothetical protein